MIKIQIEKDSVLDQPNDDACCKILKTVLENQGNDDGTITVILGQDELLRNLKKKFFLLTIRKPPLSFSVNVLQ